MHEDVSQPTVTIPLQLRGSGAHARLSTHPTLVYIRPGIRENIRFKNKKTERKSYRII